MSNAFKYHLIEPNELDIEISKKAEKALDEGNDELINSLLLELTKSGNLKEALRAIFSTLADGDKLAIASSEKVMTSQESADFLNVSRPYINKLLDAEIIPSYKDGKHRRVYFKDLIMFKIKRESAHRGLDELTEEAQKSNMGW